MKWLGFFLLSLVLSQGIAQEVLNPYGVRVAVKPVDDHFEIHASYAVPISLCAAYAFITDYEASKNIPGVVELKVISRVGNKVLVQRVIEEQILFFPIELRSLIEYTETPNRYLRFEQLSGDTKLYRGSWRLYPEKDKTVFKYEAAVEPNSLIPDAVVEYFIKNRIQNQFERMAERAAQKKLMAGPACN
jgi:Polyketide cyclase / dehydrase and lipid transport